MGLLCISSSCNKHKCEEGTEVPRITLKEFTPDSTKAKLVIGFEDCDGDIGLDNPSTKGTIHPEDTLPPFDSASYYNLLLYYHELQNGVWTLIDIDPSVPQFHYRFQRITPEGQNKSLEGEIQADMGIWYMPTSLYDTVKFQIQLLDRGLHKSNILETGTYVRPS